MAYVTIRDNSIWAKHVEGDAGLVKVIQDAPEHAEIPLVIDGVRVRFLKMKDGKDGRPTPGIRPSAGPAKDYWDEMQARRGEVVRIELDRGEPAPAGGGAGSDITPSLDDLSTLLAEWDSLEDRKAYDGL